jgi:hypothetical protein
MFSPDRFEASLRRVPVSGDLGQMGAGPLDNLSQAIDLALRLSPRSVRLAKTFAGRGLLRPEPRGFVLVAPGGGGTNARNQQPQRRSFRRLARLFRRLVCRGLRVGCSQRRGLDCGPAVFCPQRRRERGRWSAISVPDGLRVGPTLMRVYGAPLRLIAGLWARPQKPGSDPEFGR